MPKFTIDVTDAQLTKLQAVVTAHNENAGTTLTLQQWLDLHIKEVAIADDLSAAINTLHKQSEQDAQSALKAAITNARDELLAEL